MLNTIEASIVFVIWALIIVIMFGAAFFVLNKYGVVAYSVDNIITGYLLFTQDWPTFFTFIIAVSLILPVLSKYIEKESFHTPVTPLRYMITIIALWIFNFGLFWLIAWLN